MKTIGTLVAALVCVAVLVAPSAGGGQSWRALRMSRLGAAIDLPASWQDFSRRSPALRRRLRAIERENPTLAPYIRSLRVRGAIGFIAVDLDGPSAGRDFLTNLNVIHQAAPGATLAAVRRALLQELRATGSVRGQIATRVVRTRAGNALEARYVFRSSLSGVTVASAATQYLVVRKGTLFVLTYSTAPRERGHYRSVFERSARSFRFG